MFLVCFIDKRSAKRRAKPSGEGVIGRPSLLTADPSSPVPPSAEEAILKSAFSNPLNPGQTPTSIQTATPQKCPPDNLKSMYTVSTIFYV